jgi:hypothetical protein
MRRSLPQDNYYEREMTQGLPLVKVGFILPYIQQLICYYNLVPQVFLHVQSDNIYIYKYLHYGPNCMQFKFLTCLIEYIKKT